MKTNSSSNYIINGTVMLAAAAGLAFIGGLLTDWLFYSGLVVSALFVILWSLNFKFNLFMDGKVKLFSFIKYDFKNDPVHYITIVCIWGIVLFWMYQDVSNYREIGTDVLMGLFGIYLVSCVMVLWGYFVDYDNLP
jgi:hypothetical protein